MTSQIPYLVVSAYERSIVHDASSTPLAEAAEGRYSEFHLDSSESAPPASRVF